MEVMDIYIYMKKIENMCVFVEIKSIRIVARFPWVYHFQLATCEGVENREP